MFSSVGASADIAPKFTYPALPDFALRDKLLLEKECSGMYFSGHLIDSYSDMLDTLKPESMAALAECEESDNKKPARVAGIVSGITAKNTRKNEKMIFLRLEDRYGEIEALVFPRQYAQYAHLLRLDAALYIEGNLSVREDEPPKILVSQVRSLLENGRFVKEVSAEKPSVRTAPTARPEKVAQKPITKLYLRVPDLSCDGYRKALQTTQRIRGSVRVIFYDASASSYAQTDCYTDASPTILGELRALLGEENVVAK